MAGTVALGVITQDEILSKVLTLEVIRAATRRGESIQVVESGLGYLPGKFGWLMAQVAGGTRNIGRCAMPACGARARG
jgi:hypothetical protein